MKIMLLLNDGTLHEVLADPDGYNLGIALGRAVFMDSLIEGLRLHYDPFVSRDRPASEESFVVTHVGGLPIPPVTFEAPAGATDTELEKAAVDALVRMRRRDVDRLLVPPPCIECGGPPDTGAGHDCEST